MSAFLEIWVFALHLCALTVFAASLAILSFQLARDVAREETDVAQCLPAPRYFRTGALVRFIVLGLSFSAGLVVFRLHSTALLSEAWVWLDLLTVTCLLLIYWRLRVIRRLIHIPKPLRADRPYPRCLIALRWMANLCIFLIALVAVMAWGM